MPTLDLPTSPNNGVHDAGVVGDIVQMEGSRVNGKDSIKKSLGTRSTGRNATWTPPPSYWISKSHSLVDHVSRQVDAYFLMHWPFPNDRARSTYLKAGFSRVTCLYFPLARDDRIQYACRLLTVLFLIDGEMTKSRR
jgi:hypothetical protein